MVGACRLLLAASHRSSLAPRATQVPYYLVNVHGVPAQCPHAASSRLGEGSARAGRPRREALVSRGCRRCSHGRPCTSTAMTAGMKSAGVRKYVSARNCAAMPTTMLRGSRRYAIASIHGTVEISIVGAGSAAHGLCHCPAPRALGSVYASSGGSRQTPAQGTATCSAAARGRGASLGAGAGAGDSGLGRAGVPAVTAGRGPVTALVLL